VPREQIKFKHWMLCDFNHSYKTAHFLVEERGKEKKTRREHKMGWRRLKGKIIFENATVIFMRY
jgi:hypothetical protein